MIEILLVGSAAVVLACIAAAAVPWIRRMRRATLGTAVVSSNEPFRIPLRAPGRELVLDVSFTVEATGRRADEGTLALEIAPGTGLDGVRIERALGSTNDSASHTSDAGGYLRASTTFDLGVCRADATVVSGSLRVVEDGFSGTFFVSVTCGKPIRRA